MCRERLHILSFSGDNVCRVRQNVPLKVHILSPATNCAGATKCAVTRLAQVDGKSLKQLIKVKLGVNLDRTNNNKTLSSTLSKTPGHKMFVNDTGSGAQVDVRGA